MSLFPGKAAGSGTSRAGSIKVPLARDGCERALVFEGSGRCRELLFAGGRRAGTEFVACARRCTVCSHRSSLGATRLRLSRLSPADGKPGGRSEPGLKPRASASADKSVSCL